MGLCLLRISCGNAFWGQAFLPSFPRRSLLRGLNSAARRPRVPARFSSRPVGACTIHYPLSIINYPSSIIRFPFPRGSCAFQARVFFRGASPKRRRRMGLCLFRISCGNALGAKAFLPSFPRRPLLRRRNSAARRPHVPATETWTSPPPDAFPQSRTYSAHGFSRFS